MPRVGARALAVAFTFAQAQELGLEWCDYHAGWVTRLDPRTGWCALCTWEDSRVEIITADEEERERLERQEEEVRRTIAAIEAETLRGLQEVALRKNVVKTARKRTREKHNANPRKQAQGE